MNLTSLRLCLGAGLSEEFWDYEHQVDLEAFSSNTFYNLLLKHSVSVTARLGQLTTEVCNLCGPPVCAPKFRLLWQLSRLWK